MKFFKDNITPITALVTALSTIGAILLGVDAKIVDSILLLAVCLLIASVAAVRSRWAHDREQNQLYTLITNNLRPNRTKKYLGVKANIAAVGDKSCEHMFESLRAHLQKVDPELQISQFIFEEGVDKALQQGDLSDVLSGADSVILVRTVLLEKEDWVYQLVDKWAFQNSNVPIVVIDKIVPTPLPMELKEITERFYFIPDHQTSLSWRLLKRANGRSLSWRDQATFNRSITLALLILVLTLIGTVFLENYLKKREMYFLMQTSYKQTAEHTKGDYQVLLQKLIDDKQTQDDQKAVLHGIVNDSQMNFSYWLSYNGTFYPLATTDPGSSHRQWKRNEPSIVGCVLRTPNSLVSWDDGMTEPHVERHNGEQAPEDPYCRYGAQGQRRLHSMSCASWSGIPEDPDHTVAVCVFTQTDNAVANVTKGPSQFLVKQSREFYETASPFINADKFIAH